MSHYVFINVIAGIGLTIKFQSVLRDGGEALKIGVLVFFIQMCFTTFIMIIYLGLSSVTFTTASENTSLLQDLAYLDLFLYFIKP